MIARIPASFLPRPINGNSKDLWNGKVTRSALLVLGKKLLGCERTNMRNIFSQLKSELARWALLSSLAAIVITWMGLVVGIGWSVRIVNSARSLLVTAAPINAVETSGIFGRPK
jgi:hypothetical protein